MLTSQKIKRALQKIAVITITLVVAVFGIGHSIATADPFTNQQLRETSEWPNWVASTCSGAPSDQSTNGSTGNVDISDIVSKYGLQSAIIQAVGGDTVASYHADEAPTTPASTMKLIIADTALRSSLDLSKTATVTSGLFYDHNNDLGSSRVSLQNALEAMLSKSSNVGANVLMHALGGVDEFTKKAQSYGYTHTTVKGYYDPSNDGKNTSTISDEVAAMNHIFSASGAEYKSAQSALQTAAQSDNHYGVNDDANKWAGTSTVAGNVGKFKVGGNDYIVGLYINKSDSDPAAISAIKNGSADLAKAAQGSSSASAAPSPNDTGTPTTCCDAGGSDAGDAGSDGKGGDSGSWDSGLKPPYILEQWAIETLKDLAKKKGTSESDAVTKEHVTALVAFAIGEGGDINNGDLFNPLNTGIDAPELVAGGHSVSGVQSFKSFDAGVEAAARSFAKPQYSRLATALLKSDSTAKQFMHALSYNWENGGAIWAEASKDEPTYYQGRLALVRQVNGNYKSFASLVIGTPGKELPENKRDASKLKFDSGGGSVDDSSTGATCGSNGSTNATGIAAEALKLSWPDDTHGTTPTPEYKQAYDKFNSKGPGIADCGGFVATVMHASGADKDYPPGGTAAQEAYVRAHPDKYDVVDKVSSTSDLKPGDILIVNQGSGSGASGHTYIYVGPQSAAHNFDEASASLGSRAANLGKAVLSDSRGNYLRARLK